LVNRMATNELASHYPDHFALADLPYFEVRDGRLLLADPSLGPIIDVHTHLALAYVRPMGVDLWKTHDRTSHYLPLERPLDMDVYMNKNFTEDDLKRMKRDLTFTSVTPWGMRSTHTVGNITREMSELAVACSVLLPIDYPALSSNAEVYLDVAAKRDDLISLGSVHPFARAPGDKLAAQKAMGARGIKVHPAVQQVAPDHPRCMELYRLCAELDMLVFYHCGPVGIEPKRGRRLSQLKHYWPAVAGNPDTVFVLGHSGALQWELALDLAKHYPNVYLEFASQSAPAIRRILAEGPEDRIMLGSDWPFYHQAPIIAKVLAATEGRPALRRKVLYENAARLFGIAARA